jgi:hypothetical protein
MFAAILKEEMKKNASRYLSNKRGKKGVSDTVLMLGKV